MKDDKGLAFEKTKVRGKIFKNWLKGGGWGGIVL